MHQLRSKTYTWQHLISVESCRPAPVPKSWWCVALPCSTFSDIVLFFCSSEGEFKVQWHRITIFKLVVVRVFTTQKLADATNHLPVDLYSNSDYFLWFSSIWWRASLCWINCFLLTLFLSITTISLHFQAWKNFLEITKCVSVGNGVIKLLHFPEEANEIADTYISFFWLFFNNFFCGKIHIWCFIYSTHVCTCLYVHNKTSSGGKEVQFGLLLARVSFRTRKCLWLASDLKTNVNFFSIKISEWWWQ